jgi:hypothetical protein
MTFFTLLIPIMAILSNKPITDATNSVLHWLLLNSLPHPPNLSISIAGETKYEKQLHKQQEAD